MFDFKLRQTCNHVAGIIFWRQHAKRMGFVNTAYTSLLSNWNVSGENVTYGPGLLSVLVVKIELWKIIYTN